MRKQYSLGTGRPNPYAKRIGKAGRTVLLERFLRAEHYVRLDDDVAEAFRGDEIVNEALRLVMKAKTLSAAPRPVPRPRRGHKSA